MTQTRVAIVGAGQFGRHHARAVHESERTKLAAVVDTDSAKAGELAALYGCPAFSRVEELFGTTDAAIIAVPTLHHPEVGCALLEAAIDVLVEKPIAADLAGASRLIEAAEAHGRILQVGHLERFNPAVTVLAGIANYPLFFEIHRLSVFSPRSLDVDVVLDLMIHDIDIVLSLVSAEVAEIRAAGISILTPKVDIANVRLQFASGCVANLTASRVSTEKVRKLRVFQPQQYISLDYSRQDGAVFSVSQNLQISFQKLAVNKAEPLRVQFDSFLDCIQSRRAPQVDGLAARRNLEVALAILAKIEEHSRLVSQSLVTGWKP